MILYIFGLLLILILLYIFIKIKSNTIVLNKTIVIKNIVICATFMAMGAILKVYGIMITDAFRISFYSIPLILAGYICGIDFGILASIGADLIYSAFSGFPFNICYTISIMFWGFLGGVLRILCKKNLKVLIVLIGVFITSFIETNINLLSNLILYGKMTTLVSMFWKYIILVIKVPIITFLLVFIYNRVFSKFIVKKEGIQ